MLPESPRQLLFFLLSGATGFATYYAMSIVLHAVLHVPPTWAALLGLAMSVPVGYGMQKHLTFRGRATSPRAMPRYILLQAINAFVVGSAASVCSRFGVPPAASFAIAGVMGVIVSFAAQDRIVFRGTQ